MMNVLNQVLNLKKALSVKSLLPLILLVARKEMMDQPKAKILIVDDQIDLTMLIKEELEEKNYQVVTATNGQETLDIIAREGIPQLILLDMNMPIMNGWAFSQKFTDIYGRACPIVIMTAADDSPTRAMEIGADSYLGKPFEFETLNKTVESMLPD